MTSHLLNTQSISPQTAMYCFCCNRAIYTVRANREIITVYSKLLQKILWIVFSVKIGHVRTTNVVTLKFSGHHEIG